MTRHLTLYIKGDIPDIVTEYLNTNNFRRFGNEYYKIYHSTETFTSKDLLNLDASKIILLSNYSVVLVQMTNSYSERDYSLTFPYS